MGSINETEENETLSPTVVNQGASNAAATRRDDGGGGDLGGHGGFYLYGDVFRARAVI